MARISPYQTFNVYYISCDVCEAGYVGITGDTIEQRFSMHLWNAKTGRRSRLYNAIRQFGPEVFHVRLLEQVGSWAEAQEAERRLIKELKTKKPHGFNLTDGGDGVVGYEYTEEVRARMSASAKLREKNTEHEAKRIAATKVANSNRVWSSESLEKARLARLGKKASEEARAKMRAARAGKKLPEATVAKLRGKKRTPEQVERMRAGMKGKKRSVESCANIAKTARARVAKLTAEGRRPKPPLFTGKKHSPETIEKMKTARARINAARADEPEPTERFCPRCDEIKPIDAFNKLPPGNKSGKFQSYCKPCSRAYQREKYGPGTDYYEKKKAAKRAKTLAKPETTALSSPP